MQLGKNGKVVGGRLGKNKLRRFLFKKRILKICQVLAKLESLNVQSRNNFKNIIFIACKWCKICKYYENNIVISCSTCQKEEKECMFVKCLIYSVLLQFQICCNLRILFHQICIPKISEFTIFFSKSGGGVSRAHRGPWLPNSIFVLFLVFKVKRKGPTKAKIAGGFFRPIEIYYGVCRWNGNQILPHFDVLKFEIGPIKEDKIKFSNFDKITFFFSLFSVIM